MSRHPNMRHFRPISNNYDKDVEWTWDKSFSNNYIDLVNDDRDVEFHRHFSGGTAVVRGSKPFLNDQYFWEVEMISPVYGTDMMIGVGTPEADVSLGHDRFISYLGMDNHTWGLSYTGQFHHNGEWRYYSNRFGQGCVIGLHLDMWNGTLSYYINRKHLGIASRGLKGKTLYAMASSTAACSGMRIVSSCSFPSSLQFLCCARLRELIPDEKNVMKELSLPPGLQHFLENNLSWLLYPRDAETRLRVVHRNNNNRPCFVHDILNRNVESICLMRNTPFALCDCNRFKRSSEEISTQSHRNCVSGHEDSSDNNNSSPEASFEAQAGTSGTSLRTLLSLASGGGTSDDEDENPGEMGSKRRRCSYNYNYLVGLSDPDSE